MDKFWKDFNDPLYIPFNELHQRVYLNNVMNSENLELESLFFYLLCLCVKLHNLYIFGKAYILLPIFLYEYSEISKHMVNTMQISYGLYSWSYS